MLLVPSVYPPTSPYRSGTCPASSEEQDSLSLASMAQVGAFVNPITIET
jgi:hypothetical protein